MEGHHTHQVCPHCTLLVEERGGKLVHTLTGQASCNPRNPTCPYVAENPRTVIK